MKHIDEFRDPVKARNVLVQIIQTADKLAEHLGRPVQIMEICGGHTHSIFRYGINNMLPESIELIHGPGCPVCVLPMARVDDCITLAETDKVIFTSFGDALRVPGSRKNLLQCKAEGADVRMLYSPMDALTIARKNPAKEVIFFGLGFETTMPSTALTVLQAKTEELKNFSLFCNHIVIPPILRALLNTPDLILDGFLGPGHVSMIIGIEPYRFIAEEYHRPLVIAGFEPLDVLQSLWMLLCQLQNAEVRIENQYKRIVPEHGNPRALTAMDKVFETRETFPWRGLGAIEHSGVKIRAALCDFDAEKKFGLSTRIIDNKENCQCDRVLTGLIKPWQCELFANTCTPQSPIGALMVSSEGACSAYYQYGGKRERFNAQ